MADNKFTDPRTGGTFTWPKNHAPDGAEQRGFARDIDHSATTGGTAIVRQQGAEQPMMLAYSGQIIDPSHHNRMVAWTRLGGTQSIYFDDASGDRFEVLVTGFHSAPVHIGSNSIGGTIAPTHIWNYTLEMEVLEVLSGTWTSTSLT